MVYISQLLFLLFCSSLNLGLLKNYPATEIQLALWNESCFVCLQHEKWCLPPCLSAQAVVGWPTMSGCRTFHQTVLKARNCCRPLGNPGRASLWIFITEDVVKVWSGHIFLAFCLIPFVFPIPLIFSHVPSSLLLTSFCDRLPSLPTDHSSFSWMWNIKMPTTQRCSLFPKTIWVQSDS